MLNLKHFQKNDVIVVYTNNSQKKTINKIIYDVQFHVYKEDTLCFHNGGKYVYIENM